MTETSPAALLLPKSHYSRCGVHSCNGPTSRGGGEVVPVQTRKLGHGGLHCGDPTNAYVSLVRLGTSLGELYSPFYRNIQDSIFSGCLWTPLPSL